MKTIIDKLYQDGFDLSKMLELVNDAVRSQCPYRIDEWIISNCRHQIKKNIGNSYEQLSEKYFYIHNNLEPYNESLINGLDAIYLRAICDWGANSGFIAFGYSRCHKFELVPIPNNEWPFLNINKEKFLIYGEKSEYRNVKFYPSIKIKHLLTNSEREDLHLLISNNIIIESEQKREQGHISDSDNTPKLQNNKKTLIPLQRETNTALVFLYQIFSYYKVNYLYDLSGLDAWRKIISDDFSSPLIKSISDNKKSITFSDDEKLRKEDFLEKYRKRFK